MKIVLTEAQLNTLVEKFKIDDGERIKLFETDDFLLVVPLTRTASCKYGAGTRWCTTKKDDDQFERHFDMGSLAYLIVKNPDIQEKLANTKFAFFANRPKYIDGNKEIGRIVVYDDENNVMPLQSFLNFIDNAGVYQDIKAAYNKFIEYAGEKFSLKNYDQIRRGLKNPF
jgi:hypothetical protein